MELMSKPLNSTKHSYSNVRSETGVEYGDLMFKHIESLLPAQLVDQKRRRMTALINKKRAIQDEKIIEEEIMTEAKPGNSEKVRRFTINILIQLSSSIFQSVLSLFACVVFVVNTYYEDDDEADSSFFILEVVIALLFTADYLIGFASARDKKKFMINPLNILDLFTILPIFISMISSTENSSFGFTRLLRVVRAVRILRLYRLFTSTREHDQAEAKSVDSSDIQRQIFIIICTILAVIFISTGTIYTLNKSGDFELNLPDPTQKFRFETAFYYVIVTMTTIGYGDIFPLSRNGRIVIGFFLIFVIVVMTRQTSNLSELMKRSSPYRRKYKGEPKKHIVVTGAFNSVIMYRFLKEMFHPDHDMNIKDCKVVIIGNETPSKDMLGIINHPVYEEAVFYIEGDFMKEQTLSDAMLKEAKAVFILTNQYDDEPEKLDTYAVLASSAAKEFAPSTPVFLQLVKPDLLIHHYWAGWEIGFSTWKIKASLLAANAFTPGFSTMIANLVTSSSGAMKEQALNNHWMNEYILGLSNELYLVSFPDSLINAKFSDVASKLYYYHNSLLIGVQTKSDNLDDSILSEDLYEIFLNPVDYTIKQGDKAFIIAPDIEDALGIENLDIDIPTDYDTSAEVMEALSKLKSTPQNPPRVRSLEKQHFIMYEQDLRGFLWDHILVFGKIEHFEFILQALERQSNVNICFVTDSPPDHTWNRISREHPNSLYLECTLSDKEELSHTAINFAHHAIVFSSKIPGSSMEDSGILNLVNLIESCFKVHLTVELVDESNLIYFEKKPPMELKGLAYVTWPRYAASNVLFSSSLEYILAQGYHNFFIVDIIQRMIMYEDMFAETGIDQNYMINSIDIPKQLSGLVTFGEVFNYFVNLERPALVLGIYRGARYLNNEVPYVYTKPDPNTPVFDSDKLIIMGETMSRESSPYLNTTGTRPRSDTIELANYSKRNRNQPIAIKKESKSELAIKSAQEDDADLEGILSDDALLANLAILLYQNKEDREIIKKQNETLINLASEYDTIKKLLQGKSLEQILVDTSFLEHSHENY